MLIDLSDKNAGTEPVGVLCGMSRSLDTRSWSSTHFCPIYNTALLLGDCQRKGVDESEGADGSLSASFFTGAGGSNAVEPFK